jgi:hypothetical protein
MLASRRVSDPKGAIVQVPRCGGVGSEAEVEPCRLPHGGCSESDEDTLPTPITLTTCPLSIYYGWYGRKFTDVVLAATGYDASARLEDLMPAHIPHVHDFARDVNLTTEEHIRKSVTSWVEFSKSSRTETHIVGLRSLQVCIV